jgi:hypothetical protein
MADTVNLLQKAFPATAPDISFETGAEPHDWLVEWTHNQGIIQDPVFGNK